MDRDLGRAIAADGVVHERNRVGHDVQPTGGVVAVEHAIALQGAVGHVDRRSFPDRDEGTGRAHLHGAAADGRRQVA